MTRRPFLGVFSSRREADIACAASPGGVAYVAAPDGRGLDADLVAVDELSAVSEFADVESGRMTATEMGLLVPSGQERIENLLRDHMVRASERMAREFEHMMFGPEGPSGPEEEQQVDLDGRPVRPERPDFSGLPDISTNTWANLRAELTDALFFGPGSYSWRRFIDEGPRQPAPAPVCMGQRRVDTNGRVWRSARDGEGGFWWTYQPPRWRSPDEHAVEWDDETAAAADDFDAMLADIGAAKESLRGRRE